METTTIAMFHSTIKYSGESIFIQPFCDFFGIDYLNQKRLINSHPFLKTSVSKKTSMLLFGDERERLAFTKQGFLAWILQLKYQIVHPNLKESLLKYQSSIFEFLFGNVQREDEVRAKYARLSKLKKLKTKIGKEIVICERDVRAFMDERLSPQAQIDFSNQNQKQLS